MERSSRTQCEALSIKFKTTETKQSTSQEFSGTYRCHRRRQWHPTPVLLPGKPHGRRSLVGCCPWGRWELDTTERLPFHFSLSCIGEGNGNPLQCSCLEDPRDGGPWLAAVYGGRTESDTTEVTSSRSSKETGVLGSSTLSPDDDSMLYKMW